MDLRTEEIISRFKKSWIETELFYDNLLENDYGFGRMDLLKQFISKLRIEGEDINFRLGTSIHFLIISRSVDHGLRDGQKRIIIDTLDNNDFEVTFKDGWKTYRQCKVNDLNDVRVTELLKALKDTMVD